MKHGTEEIAVFSVTGVADTCVPRRWFATQNICPHKQARTISRGLVGETLDGKVTLADPIYKTMYNLDSGEGISNSALNLSTFEVNADSGTGKVTLADPIYKTMYNL